MLPLKLKVFLIEEERKIENFNEEQWCEICIIFQKLVRNLKEEMTKIKIENFCADSIPFVTMEISFEDDDDEDVDEDRLQYIASYLSGEETENPVYFNNEGEPLYAKSTIVLEENKSESLMDRFNSMVDDLRNANIN